MILISVLTSVILVHQVKLNKKNNIVLFVFIYLNFVLLYLFILFYFKLNLFFLF